MQHQHLVHTLLGTLGEYPRFQGFDSAVAFEFKRASFSDVDFRKFLLSSHSKRAYFLIFYSDARVIVLAAKDTYTAEREIWRLSDTNFFPHAMVLCGF